MRTAGKAAVAAERTGRLRATLNRLLLVLFGLGTNMGIRQMAITGEHGLGEAELRHVRATYVTRENLRAAITTVVNATLEGRDSAWWGEATSTASDSKRFASWDSNLMTEFHARYGGYGVMIYWHVERKSVCIYSQLKSCSASSRAALSAGGELGALCASEGAFCPKDGRATSARNKKEKNRSRMRKGYLLGQA